jgi:hypothetical protein
MQTYQKNVVLTPNPFGETSEKALQLFEASIGNTLPSDYRRYLLLYNGALVSNRRFSGDRGSSGRLHTIYGLHDGPEYAQLSLNWRLSDCYDIGNFAPGVNDFIVFGDTGTGDLLLIKTISGEIFFLDHETIQYKQDEWVAEKIEPIKLAATFDSFIESLEPD